MDAMLLLLLLLVLGFVLCSDEALVFLQLLYCLSSLLHLFLSCCCFSLCRLSFSSASSSASSFSSCSASSHYFSPASRLASDIRSIKFR